MGNKKLELRALKLDESDLNSLFLLEVSDGLWSFTTDALDEQRETFGRALNYWVEKNPDSTKADLRPFQPLLCFHVSKNDLSRNKFCSSQRTGIGYFT